ncbi:MAG TPA: phosphoglucosamine mutase [Candidatus Polarisedimenticolia bacterium]|nr:phosphoglucosamine mutase [Candidatus Polarisedimenticolia bacterium]
MKRLFGTDGVRGVAGKFPLDEETVVRIGEALARTLTKEGRPPRVVIGRDTRASGPDIEAALTRGIESQGGTVDRGGVLTTPAVACVTKALGYDAGVVISASHNPYRDNGIKVFSGEGFKLPDALEMEIERQVLDGPANKNAAKQASGAGGGRHIDAGALQKTYLDALRGSVPAGTTFAGRRLVLDCAHGAASDLGPRLFRSLGAEVVALHDAPDGSNINEGCGALHPDRLGREVARQQAWLGLAFDGDADRCLPVDASGRVLDGDYVLCLAARDLRRAGRLHGDTTVGTVMTNLWLERSLKEDGIRVVRAPVGDKYVLEEMQRGGFVLGGEQSGHVIFLERATTGDGLLTGLMLMELLQRTGQDLAAWASTITPCPQILVNVPVRERPPLETHPVIGPAIAAEEKLLKGRGRVLVRYSGTEPKARIMVEGESRSAIEDAVGRLTKVLEATIGA